MNRLIGGFFFASILSRANAFTYQSDASKLGSPIASSAPIRPFITTLVSKNKKQTQPFHFTTTTTTSFQSTSSAKAESPLEFDSEAVLKYVVSGIVEMSCFTGAFYILDLILAQASVTDSIPSILIGFVFYACSIKSRVFNPLNNQRPDLKKAVTSSEQANGFNDRIMPSWTPPGFIFPIMWLLIIGPIRAYSSTLIVEANQGLFCTPATLAFMFHLTVGDIWNTINNTEKRYGAAVIGVVGVVLSVAFAATQYAQVDPVAGKWLAGTGLWLVTAATLIADTWRLNVDGEGKRDVLYPTKVVGEESITQFAWFTSADDEGSGN